MTAENPVVALPRCGVLLDDIGTQCPNPPIDPRADTLICWPHAAQVAELLGYVIGDSDGA
jgi:hypothetical protein